MTDNAPIPDIHGVCPLQFEAVFDAFAANFGPGKDAGEVGARFTAIVDDELLVDLWGGQADRSGAQAFDDTTLCPVFSTGKAVAALMVARLVGEGRLDYDQTVASVWPQFAAGGKAGITIEQALSHQAGLVGFREGFDPDLWFDWDAACARVAAAEPLWPPGSASGYHPNTFGFIAGEIFRRVDGRSLGTALRQDVCEPLGIEFWYGLPEALEPRLCHVYRPTALPALGEMTEVRQLAFMKPWSSPPGRDGPRWRRAELPASNGHGNALALARLMGAFACDGRVEGHEVLAPGTAAQAARARITGDDLVLPFRVSWGAGVLRNQPVGIYGPGEQAFGHSGWGGSCAFADPERRLSGAYVMNRQSPHLIGDPRSRRLIDALYASL